MSKKANPTLIGLFIVLGLALGVGAVLLVSSSKLFSKTHRYILYFDASVKGLNPGAPVKFRGVTVGSVSDMMIRLNQAEGDLHMPVIIEVNEALLRQKTDRSIDLQDDVAFAAMVKKGLRGLLQAQSFVTGLLYVELDVLPNAPPPVFHQQERVYREIPTASTDIQQLLDNVAKLDLKGISEKLNSILAKLDTSLGEIQVRDINSGLTNLLASLNRLVRSPDMTNTLATARESMEEFRLLSEKLRRRIDPLADGTEKSLQEASLALAEIRAGVQELRDLLAPQTPLRRDLLKAVDELGRAAHSLSVLAEYLARNPNALISGRKQLEPSP